MNIAPREKEIEYVISILKASVVYDEEKNIHWLGINSILTNRDMHGICINRFGNDYEFMSPPERRKLRERIFRELRGETNG